MESKETKLHQEVSSLAILESEIRKLQYRQDALIEVLHIAQNLFSYLSKETLRYVAKQLKLPYSKVQGVATFYHLFRLQPPAEHTCIVCTGTACYVKGAYRLLETVESWSGLQEGHISEDSKISLRSVRCLEPCGIAPVVVIDGKVRGHETPEKLLQELKGWFVNVKDRS